MAVKKDELNEIMKRDKENTIMCLADELEGRIDTNIKLLYGLNRKLLFEIDLCEISYWLSREIQNKVKEELSKRFEAAGWEVEFTVKKIRKTIIMRSCVDGGNTEIYADFDFIVLK